MTVGELKQLLKGFPPDADSMEVVVLSALYGQQTTETIAGMGYIPMENPITGEDLTKAAIVTISDAAWQYQNGLLIPESYNHH